MMEAFSVALLLFILVLSIIWSLVPRNDPYEHSDDPELDALIKELLAMKIERKRHLTIVRNEDTSGQTDSKKNH